MIRIAHLATASSLALAVVLSTPASSTAIPIPIDPVALVATPDNSGPTDRPCFIVQAHWNAALDGPQPRCPLS